jgi:hypothetical protein
MTPKGAGSGKAGGIPWFTSREEPMISRPIRPTSGQCIVLEIVGTILLPEKPDVLVEAV